jgi:hypothetical protein
MQAGTLRPFSASIFSRIRSPTSRASAMRCSFSVTSRQASSSDNCSMSGSMLGEDFANLLADRLVNVERGLTKARSGQHWHFAGTDGMAERTPNLGAS